MESYSQLVSIFPFPFYTYYWLNIRVTITIIIIICWLRAKVPGSSPGGDSQFFSDFSGLSLSLKPVNVMTWGSSHASLYVKCVGYSEGCVPPACVDSQEV